MKKELLIIPPFREDFVGRLYNTEGYNVVFSASPAAEELEKAEVIIGMPKQEYFEKAKNLKWVQITSAGNDEYIAGAHCFPEGVTLTNLSGAFGRSMSEFALMLTLCFYKHLHLYRDNQRKHMWHDEGRQLSPRGRNVLLLGAGNIACETAALFKAFDCNITAIRRTPGCEAVYPFDSFKTTAELDDELKKADIVICALPSTPQTRGLLGRERLSLLKADAVLINLGRGSLIDTDALTELLKGKKILGAALDVTDPEPLPPEHPLWDCENAMILPHITGGSFGHLDETEKRLIDICSENLLRYSKGEPLMNKVDFSSGYRQNENRIELL